MMKKKLFFFLEKHVFYVNRKNGYTQLRSTEEENDFSALHSAHFGMFPVVHTYSYDVPFIYENEKRTGLSNCVGYLISEFNNKKKSIQFSLTSAFVDKHDCNRMYSNSNKIVLLLNNLHTIAYVWLHQSIVHVPIHIVYVLH